MTRTDYDAELIAAVTKWAVSDMAFDPDDLDIRALRARLATLTAEGATGVPEG